MYHHHTKKVMQVLFLSVVICGYGTTLFAQIDLSYQFESFSIQKTKEKPASDIVHSRVSEELYTYIRIPRTTLYAPEEGYPMLPMRTAKILIPDQHAVTGIKLIPGRGRELDGYYNIGYRRRPQITTNRETPGHHPNVRIYESKEKYPGKFHEKVGLQNMDGATVLFIRLYPVQYIPYTGQVIVFDDLQVVVETRRDERSEKEEEVKMTTLTNLINFVDNPYILTTYPNVILSKEGMLYLDPRIFGIHPPEFLGSYKYIIITDKAFASRFQVLADHKKSRGITSRVFTTSMIYNDYSGARPDGQSDHQTSIRNFIAYAKSHWMTEYILLGGDDEIVPHRGARGGVGTSYLDNDIPTDLYYACLGGTWDNDADGIYGESNDGAGGGEIDLLSDVYVGRASVDTTDEVDNFVKKTIAFEKKVHDKQALMTGTILNSDTWGGDHKDIVAAIFPGSWTKDTLYDRDNSATTPSVVNAINSDKYIIINNAGHGSNNWFSYLNRNAVDGLTNTLNPFLYTWACYTSAFDNRWPNSTYDTNDCIAEHFIENNSGAFAFVGNSRYGWYAPGSTNGPSQQYDETFFETLFNDNIINLGKTLADSKEDLIASVGSTGAYRWVYFDLNLLGDPETPMSTGPVCYPRLKMPEVEFVKSESYTVNGVDYIRYRLRVTNWNIYPNDMFAPAPYLPACGLNSNASRTWIHIYNESGARLYGFCAFNSSDDLTKIWFAVKKGDTPPKGVSVVLQDRACDNEYESEVVAIPN